MLTSRQMELMERAIKLGLPATALDDLIDQLGGPDHVAEMTARLPLLGTLVPFFVTCVSKLFPPNKSPADTTETRRHK